MNESGIKTNHAHSQKKRDNEPTIHTKEEKTGNVLLLERKKQGKTQSVFIANRSHDVQDAKGE